MAPWKKKLQNNTPSCLGREKLGSMQGPKQIPLNIGLLPDRYVCFFVRLTNVLGFLNFHRQCPLKTPELRQKNGRPRAWRRKRKTSEHLFHKHTDHSWNPRFSAVPRRFSTELGNHLINTGTSCYIWNSGIGSSVLGSPASLYFCSWSLLQVVLDKSRRTVWDVYCTTNGCFQK